MPTRIDSIALSLVTGFMAAAAPCFADVEAEPAASPLPQLRSSLAVPLQSEPVSATLDWTQGQQWHKATMALSGSICITCLIELEGKLRAVPGIPYAKISRAFPAPADASSKDKPAETAASSEKEVPESTGNKRIDAVLIYDSNAVKFDKLLTFIKNEKYKPAEVKDSAITRESK